MTELARQLKRGTLEMILLQLLSERPKYGYELVSELAERSTRAFELKEGTLYPVLYRLEDQQLIAPQWNRPERGVPRKYYRLTPAGSARLSELRDQWQQFAQSVNRLLGPPPSPLEGEARQNVDQPPTSERNSK